MDRSYWDSIADYYEVEIFNVLENDQAGLLLSKLNRYGITGESASDIGCGIGNFLPELSRRFQEVLAVDISSKCIARAQEEYSHLPNVSYKIADLAAPDVQLPKVDFALSVNSIITPSIKHRNNMLDELCRHLQVEGHLVLVVPSLESAFLSDFRLIELNLRNGMTSEAAVQVCLQTQKQTNNPRLHDGVVLIDDVETKHYLKEEVVVLLRKRGMKIIEIEKIEYPWKMEYISPPRWMKDPLPWDWLFVAQKVK
jgi:ubiquinone/menaquinone biosynthesis C-methylase UbiE